MISTFAFAAALSIAFPAEYGIWQPDPDSGIVECSDVQANSGTYSAYLMVKAPGDLPSDSNEAYVRPYEEGYDVPQLLDDLDSFSFYYFRPSTLGEHSNIPPQVDIWLATTGIGGAEDEWLLGQIDLATTIDTWVEVPLSAITWIKAMGGTIYGTGSAGLEAAKLALAGSEILGFGVQLGSPATRDDSRTEEGRYYIDDIEINSVVYSFEPSGPVSISGESSHPIVSISVTPTSIDFGPLVLGKYYDVADVTVENTGETDVALTAELMDDDGFYALSLYLDDFSVASWSKSLAESASKTVDLELDIPRDADPGEHTAVLVFWAEEA